MYIQHSGCRNPRVVGSRKGVIAADKLVSRPAIRKRSHIVTHNRGFERLSGFQSTDGPVWSAVKRAATDAVAPGTFLFICSSADIGKFLTRQIFRKADTNHCHGVLCRQQARAVVKHGSKPFWNVSAVHWQPTAKASTCFCGVISGGRCSSPGDQLRLNKRQNTSRSSCPASVGWRANDDCRSLDR